MKHGWEVQLGPPTNILFYRVRVHGWQVRSKRGLILRHYSAVFWQCFTRWMTVSVLVISYRTHITISNSVLLPPVQFPCFLVVYFLTYTELIPSTRTRGCNYNDQNWANYFCMLVACSFAGLYLKQTRGIRTITARSWPCTRCGKEFHEYSIPRRRVMTIGRMSVVFIRPTAMCNIHLKYIHIITLESIGAITIRGGSKSTCTTWFCRSGTAEGAQII